MIYIRLEDLYKKCFLPPGVIFEERLWFELNIVRESVFFTVSNIFEIFSK